MAFFYVRHNVPFLKQGEILTNLLEFKLQIPRETNISAIKEPKFDPIYHPYAIVVSQGCDLEWDYNARAGEALEHKLLTHVLFCGLFSREEITDQSKRKSRVFSQIKDGRDERYHYLAPAPIDGTDESMPESTADFKTTFSLPVELVYWLVSTGQAIREGALVSPYLEEFMHRLYSYLGRVATPDEIMDVQFPPPS